MEIPGDDPKEEKDLHELNQVVKNLENQNKFLNSRILELSELLEKQNDRRQRIERRLALHPVTGIPSHYRLHLELKEILDFADISQDGKNGPHSFALIIIQIDQSFNMLRKTLKSSISEWVLYQSGLRIQEYMGPSDRVFHTRENEFILVVHGDGEQGLYETYVKNLLTRFIEPHIFSGFNLTIGANAGIAVYPKDGREKGDLLHHADIALGVAIEENRPYAFFTWDYKSQVIEKMELQNSIIKAIEAPAMQEIGNQFEVFYQPKVTIKTMEGDMVLVASIEAESLIRWRHPQKGLISPAKFIPLAEESGLILPLGKWIFFQVIKAIQRWQALGLDLKVSINISSRQFKSGDLIDIVDCSLKENPSLAKSVTLELTETSLFENPLQALEVLKNLKDRGLHISLDDFGTGYSSLSHLHRFPLDEIKIDQSFVREFPQNEQDRAIVQSLSAMARELKLKAVVEGVEHFHQIPPLLDLGCKEIQGYVFSAPLPEQEFIKFCSKILAQNGWVKFQDNRPYFGEEK